MISDWGSLVLAWRSSPLLNSLYIVMMLIEVCSCSIYEEMLLLKLSLRYLWNLCYYIKRVRFFFHLQQISFHWCITESALSLIIVSPWLNLFGLELAKLRLLSNSTSKTWKRHLGIPQFWKDDALKKWMAWDFVYIAWSYPLIRVFTQKLHDQILSMKRNLVRKIKVCLV